MRGLTLLSLFLIIGLSLSAQSSVKIKESTKIIGHSSLTNQDIQAREFVFPDSIKQLHVDTLSYCLNVTTQRATNNKRYPSLSGLLIRYDLQQSKVNWSKKIKYDKYYFRFLGPYIFMKNYRSSIFLNNDNGEQLWDMYGEVFDVSFKNFGVGMSNTDGSTHLNVAKGYNLTNGAELWERSFSYEYEGNTYLKLSDSVILLVADGIHTLNLKDGSGLDYDAVIGVTNYSAVSILNRLGFPVNNWIRGLVTSPALYVVRGVFSNILYDSTKFCFASKDEIVRLNRDGKVMWSSPLPTDLTSSSRIFIEDSILCIVNMGVAYYWVYPLWFGVPFVAGFDLNSGKQLYFSSMLDDRSNVRFFKHLPGSVLLFFKDRISKFSSVDGSLLVEKHFKTDVYGELDSIVSSKSYVKVDARYKELKSSDSTLTYIYFPNNRVLVFNKDADMVFQLSKSMIYSRVLEYKDYIFLAKGNEMVVVDKNGSPVAELALSTKAKIFGSKLYDNQDEKCYEVDLDSIIKKE